MKGVGRLPQRSPLQGAFPVRGPSGNEKCLLYGGYDGVSGLTASAPVRLPLCRHRRLAALTSARCGLLSRSRSSSSRSCSHGPCGAGAAEGGQPPLPAIPRVTLEESTRRRARVQGCKWGQGAPVHLPTFPTLCFSPTYQPTGKKTGFLKSLEKMHVTSDPRAMRETKSFCPRRKRQGHLCRSQFSGLPSPLFSQI